MTRFRQSIAIQKVLTRNLKSTIPIYSASCHFCCSLSHYNYPQLKLQLPTLVQWGYADSQPFGMHTKHKKAPLTDIDKFTYLRSLVSHSARNSNAGLSLSFTNYQEAISALEKNLGTTNHCLAHFVEPKPS